MDADNSLMDAMLMRTRTEPEFFAWYLQRVAADEGISFNALSDKLCLQKEQLLRLALCKVPNSRRSDFATRLKAIEAFTGAHYFQLASIIRKGDLLKALEADAINTSAVLLAARKQDELPDEHENPEEV